LRLPASLRKLHFQLYTCATKQKKRSVSRLFDDPAACMFPPLLCSLQLPSPVDTRTAKELQKNAKGVTNSAAIIWIGSTPLHLSLLPPSLRFLRIHRSQAVVCDAPSSSSSSASSSASAQPRLLHIEELDVLRGAGGARPSASRKYSGQEACRKKLYKQVRWTERQYKAKSATHRFSSSSSSSSAAAATATAGVLDSAAAAPASSVPVFTMGTSKRG
jgi:hypothetical protein